MITLDRRAVIVGTAAVSTLALSGHGSAQTGPGRFRLDPLPFPANALEPHIDARTMEIHHGKHHAKYVDDLNAALKDYPLVADQPLDRILGQIGELPQAIRTAVRNSGGGHANHTMFWQILGPNGGQPDGELSAAVERDFGGLEKMKAQFNQAGTGVFGSGWVFMTVDRAGKLTITTKPNQDTPLMDRVDVLMGNDVWEHAYYLNYQNRRADYLKAWWNVVDWKKVGERYAQARAGKLSMQ